MIIKINADDKLLKPGEHLIIQIRSPNEDKIEEIFRWTFPGHLGFEGTLKGIRIEGLKD